MHKTFSCYFELVFQRSHSTNNKFQVAWTLQNLNNTIHKFCNLNTT